MKDELTFRAPAKINLGLRVGPQDDQGYHEVRTVYQTISLSDRLTVRKSPTDSDRLTISGPVTVPSNSDNLILRALSALRDRGFAVPPLSVNLRKAIPVQAGLGGGSSDAAVTLKAVDQILDGTISWQELVGVARYLGSDVPFFLKGGTRLGTGRGDELHPLPSLGGQGLLCVPPYGVSTEWAYDHVQPRDREELPGLIETEDDAALESWDQLDLTNDFEPVLSSEKALHPKLLGILTELSSSSGLTGSGSALYALFDKSKDINTLHEQLSADYDECRWYQFDFIPGENER